MLIAAALLFVSSGVAFAKDRNDRDHKPGGKTYGYEQAKKQPLAEPIRTLNQILFTANDMFTKRCAYF